jgi:hypothetical protein
MTPAAQGASQRLEAGDASGVLLEPGCERRQQRAQRRRCLGFVEAKLLRQLSDDRVALVAEQSFNRVHRERLLLEPWHDCLNHRSGTLLLANRRAISVFGEIGLQAD